MDTPQTALSVPIGTVLSSSGQEERFLPLTIVAEQKNKVRKNPSIRIARKWPVAAVVLCTVVAMCM